MDDNEDLLTQIWNAEQDCRSCDTVVESQQEKLKEAKALRDAAVIRLRMLASEAYEGQRADENDAERPLLPSNVDDMPELLHPDERPDVDNWKLEPISVLWADPIKGLGKKKQQDLIDEVTSLGDFAALHNESMKKDSMPLHVLLPKGISGILASELLERFLVFVSNYNNETTPDDPVVAQIKNRIAELDWREHVIKDPGVFVDGEDASKERIPSCECPWTEGDKQDDWLCGWLKKVNEEIEADEEMGIDDALKQTPKPMPQSDIDEL